MDSLGSGTAVILFLIFTIVSFVIYHKIFNMVIYFGKGGILREVIGCFLSGIILTTITLYFWKIVLVIIILVALVGIAKYKDLTIRVLIGVLAVFLGIVIVLTGRQVENLSESNQTEDSEEYDDEYEEYDEYDEYEEDDEYNENYTDGEDYESDEEYSYDEENADTGYIDQSDYFIFEDSDSRYLEDSELLACDTATLRLARNEIYARHGRIFRDEELQAYFESRPWYIGRVDAEDFSEDVLNKYEKRNLEKIVQYENR